MRDISDDIDWSKPVCMTEEQYLAFDDQSRDKHEYDADGHVIPLSRANRGEPNLWYYRRQAGRQRKTTEHSRCVENLRQVFKASCAENVIGYPAADAAASIGVEPPRRIVALVRSADANDETTLARFRSDDTVEAILIVSTAHPSLWLQTRDRASKASWFLRIRDEADNIDLPATSPAVPVERFYAGVPFGDETW
ncbi:MAG: hypothetical protein AAGI46_12105 [Planctomycetota bacterium]